MLGGNPRSNTVKYSDSNSIGIFVLNIQGEPPNEQTRLYKSLLVAMAKELEQRALQALLPHEVVPPSPIKSNHGASGAFDFFGFSSAWRLRGVSFVRTYIKAQKVGTWI